MTDAERIEELEAQLAKVEMDCRSYETIAVDAIHRMDGCKAQLAKVTAERDAYRDAAEHWKSERKLRERAYDLKGQEETLLRRAEVAEAALDKLAKVQALLLDVGSSLAAAISLLEHGGREAAPSDKMFEQMIIDYRGSLERLRTALAQFKETER